MASLADIRRRTAAIRPKSVSWARIVSDIVSPPVVWAVVGLMVGMAYGATVTEGTLWGVVFGVFICWIPLIFVALMVWRGRISDIHMQHRRERILPMVVTIISSLAALWLVATRDAPPVFYLLILIALVQITLMLAITLFWQISMHTMSITAAIIAMGTMFSMTAGLVLVPLIVLVAAARLNLKRHTPGQVLGGTVVGGIVPLIVLSILHT
ncbi:MAG: hypothetical protein CL607_28600 [Anaerolineaceae bacterium]|nr:hypothetical protein [Anaerolineaceae bacterium]